jgi:hypothetical protein
MARLARTRRTDMKKDLSSVRFIWPDEARSLPDLLRGFDVIES